MGLYILFRDVRSPVNRLFFFMSLCMSLWFLPSIYLYSTTDHTVAIECIRYASVGIMLFVPAVLHFSLLVSREKGLLMYYLLYLPFIIIALINIFEPVFFSRIYMADGYWHFIPNFESFTHKIYSFLALGYVLYAILILFRSHSQTKSNRKKRQLLIIVTSLLMWVVIITSEEILLPAFITDFTFGLAPITFIIAMAGMAYSILKYRFLEYPLSLAGLDVINNIEETVILLDADLRVDVINRRALNLLCSDAKAVHRKKFTDLIDEKEKIQSEISAILEGRHYSHAAMFHFTAPSPRHLMNATFSSIKDDMGDSVGILIIARETRDNEFIVKYHISNREMTVILEILSGLTNGEIAEKLCISELTVKSHITSIYNKLDITNRVRLLELLKQYHIAP